MAGGAARRAAAPVLLDLGRGPEALFAVSRFEPGELVVAGEIPAPADGDYSWGLGVLVDDVLGYAIVAARPVDGWSVSTQISIDFVPTSHPVTGFLRAEGRLLHVDERSGFACGKVIDESGQVIAYCRQRGRFVQVPGGRQPHQQGTIAAELPPATHDELRELLHLDEATEESLTVPVTERLQNPLGNLHGGISLALSGWLGSSGRPVSSISVEYVRAVPGGATPTFSATSLHHGRTLAVTQVVSSVVPGKPCTIATVTRH